MKYEHQVVDPASVPQAADAVFQHVVETYAGETSKTASTWLQFSDEDLVWKPHA